MEKRRPEVRDGDSAYVADVGMVEDVDLLAVAAGQEAGRTGQKSYGKDRWESASVGEIGRVLVNSAAPGVKLIFNSYRREAATSA